jgi:hypothetical protein
MIGLQRGDGRRIAHRLLGECRSLTEDERACYGHQIKGQPGSRLCLKKMPLLLRLCAFACGCLPALQGTSGEVGQSWHGGEGHRLEGLCRLCRGIYNIYYLLRLCLFLETVQKTPMSLLAYRCMEGILFAGSSRQHEGISQFTWPTSHASCHRCFRHGLRWIPRFPPAGLSDKPIRHRYPD